MLDLPGKLNVAVLPHTPWGEWLAHHAPEPCMARLDEPDCAWVLDQAVPWDTDAPPATGGGL